MITLNGEPINITKFPDGTSQVWKLDEKHFKLASADVQWTFEDEAEIMHLAQLAMLLRKFPIFARLDISYLPYARQDKNVSNDQTFALHAFAGQLNAMQWDSIVLHDPHSHIAQLLIKRSRVEYYGNEAVDCMNETGSDVLCFPDAGANTKYGKLFRGIASVSTTKIREQSTGYVVTGEILGDVRGKRVLIVDDICDGGATFIGLASKLRDAGASDVFLFVSHGLFTRGVSALTNAGISRVFTPNGEVFP